MKFVVQLFSVATVCTFVGLFLLAGCQKSHVEAVPRTSNAKPVFGSALSSEKEKKSGDINFDFVHPDHFACLSFDVPRILARQELEEFSWDAVESQLAESVGKANADLQSIERVWLLLDREGTAAAMEGNTKGLLVTVIEYQKSPDLEQLAEASSNQDNSTNDSSENNNESSESGPESKKDDQSADELDATKSKTVAQQISERRIAIGSKLVVDKLKGFKNPAATSKLVQLLTQLDFSSDVEGVIATGPVRETLKSVFGVAAQFGGAEAKKFAGLPDVLEQIEIRFSLEQDDSDLLNIKAMIDDKSMIDDVVRATQKAIERSNSEASPKGTGGLFGRALKKRSDGEESESAKIAEEVGREIQEKNLFFVEGADDFVSFRLSRPTKISELMRALVDDMKRSKPDQEAVTE